MWLTRHHYPTFKDIVDARTIYMLLVWLVGCMIASYFGVWNVGNAAHISGLVFGTVVAEAFVGHFKPALIRVGLLIVVIVVICAIVPNFWSPWSVSWLSCQAYNAHAAEQFEVAWERYTQVINLDPSNAWAYLNRSYVY